MKRYFSPDPWRIIEDGFHAESQRVSESVFSLGNGRMGQRGNFEEHYSGDSMQGNYFAGIYYPDKTKVGWWKNGYPEYFAKVLNAVHWSGMDLQAENRRVDLATIPASDFRRILDMQSGLLQRTFSVTFPEGTLVFSFERFCSMAHPDVGAVRLILHSKDFSGTFDLKAFLNCDVHNEDANWEESFWEDHQAHADADTFHVRAKTRKTGFVIASAGACRLNGEKAVPELVTFESGEAAHFYRWPVTPGDKHVFDKIIVHHSSLYYPAETLSESVQSALQGMLALGYEGLREAHTNAWKVKWESADIEIDGDVGAQQAIRFCIFQLLQTYTGDDARLNIGPKGFTGEKYGGSTYWDTEAYCLPFYLGTCPPKVGHQLLVYRYRHLQKAIENATKLGFKDGAALYPMVTMNGEECHNEWEITFEEIHRNGAIAYAIYDFIRYTGDDSYLFEGGLEVLIGIARFWAQRIHFSERRQKFVMLGVTGPNEYENNVDNNWYTNYIAIWCLRYTLQCLEIYGSRSKAAVDQIVAKTHYHPAEGEHWQKIIDGMHFPKDDQLGIFLQQENYLDKVQMTAAELSPQDRPLNQKWSWDRILRSCFIKQADVLQGLYFFEDEFDLETIRRNYLFYEPRTVHESSLSPCIHSIQASLLDMPEKAYEMYLRTGRLDLDNYNHDTEDGLHITSMAGTWLAIVKGFAGVRIKDDVLHLRPKLPVEWKGLTFHLFYRGAILKVAINAQETIVSNISGNAVRIQIGGQNQVLLTNTQHAVPSAQIH